MSPRLPTYNSKAQMTTQAQPIRTGAGQTAKALEGVAQVGQDIALDWQKTQDTIDSAKSLASFELGVKREEALASQDNDTSDENKKAYAKRIQDIKGEALKLVRSPSARQKIELEMGFKADVANLNINTDFAKKDIQAGIESLNILLEVEQSNYVAGDDAQRLVARQRMDAIIEEGFNGNLYDRKTAEKLKEDTIKEAQGYLADAKSLRKLKEKELKMALDKARNQNEVAFINMKLSGQTPEGVPVTREDMLTMASRNLKAGTMTQEFFDAFKLAITSPKTLDAVSQDPDFGSIMEDINKTTVEFGTIRTRMLKASANGNLSPQDEATLTAYINMLEKESPDSMVSQEIKQNWWGLQADTPAEDKSVLKDRRKQARIRMSLKYINLVTTGVAPKTASLEVQRAEVLFWHKDPIPKEGTYVIDMFGNERTILPNGDVIPYKQKVSQ